MVKGMAIHEVDEGDGPEWIKPCEGCTTVDVELSDGRKWMIFVHCDEALQPREEALVRATAQLIGEATAELVGVEELLEDRTPEQLAEAVAALPETVAAEAATEVPRRIFRRVHRTRRFDPFGYHDHAPVNGGNCKPYSPGVHHEDCASLFSNNNEGQCLVWQGGMYRCWHGTLL